MVTGVPDIALPCLCLVTDRSRVAPDRTLEDVVEEAVAGGTTMVQLREKDLPASEMLDLACALREITLGRALLFVNDRVDVALACEADGVQLGESGLTVEAARRVSQGRLILGRSVHSVEGAVAAETLGADMLIAGTIFPTTSHTGVPTAGVGLLSQIGNAVDIPVLAIGGVTSANISSVVQAGASGAAVIGEVMSSPDPLESSKALVDSMRGSWISRPVRTVSHLT